MYLMLFHSNFIQYFLFSLPLILKQRHECNLSHLRVYPHQMSDVVYSILLCFYCDLSSSAATVGSIEFPNLNPMSGGELSCGTHIRIGNTRLFFLPPATTQMTSNAVVKQVMFYSLCYNPSLRFMKSDYILLYKFVRGHSGCYIVPSEPHIDVHPNQCTCTQLYMYISTLFDNVYFNKQPLVVGCAETVTLRILPVRASCNRKLQRSNKLKGELVCHSLTTK